MKIKKSRIPQSRQAQQVFSRPLKSQSNIHITIDDKIKAEGTVVLDRQILDSSAELDLTVDWPKFPTINAELHYDSREARVFASALDHLASQRSIPG